MLQIAMKVLWPSFLAAALAEGCFFALVDPHELMHVREVALTAGMVYSIGFFFFWALCALASLLTYYLVVVPDDHQPF